MTEPDNRPSPPAPPARCPHCEHRNLIQIQASELIVIYKCASCGDLVAPVKPPPKRYA